MNRFKDRMSTGVRSLNSRRTQLDPTANGLEKNATLRQTYRIARARVLEPPENATSVIATHPSPPSNTTGSYQTHGLMFRQCTYAIVIVSLLLHQAVYASNPKTPDEILEPYIQYYRELATADQEQKAREAQKAAQQHLIENASRDSAAIMNRRPTLRNEWALLQLGEFETEIAFTNRQMLAMERELATFNGELARWNEEVQTSQRKAEEVSTAAKIRQDSLREMGMDAYRRIERTKWHGVTSSGSAQVPGFSLPLFDRTNMLFGPIRLSLCGTSHVNGVRHDHFMASTVLNEQITFNVRLSSLDSAKAFKERFESGLISLVFPVANELIDVEEPVILQNRVVEMRTTVDQKETIGNWVDAGLTLAWGFGAAALFTALGADPNSNEIREFSQEIGGKASGNMRKAYKTHEVEVQPEISKQGVRFWLNGVVTEIRLVDQSGTPIAGVEVVRLDRCRVKRLTNATQPAARVLRPEDTILRVGNTHVYSTGMIRQTLRSYAPGESVAVIYRRQDESEDRNLSVVGGMLLGIEMAE